MLFRSFITSFVNEGDFFGFVDVLENQNYRETAEALEDCKVISVSAQEFLRYIDENVHLEVFFRKAVTAYLFQNEKNTDAGGELFSMSVEEYNALADAAILHATSLRKNFIIKDRTGPNGEQALFIIQNGRVTGYLQSHRDDLPGGTEDIIERQQLLPDAPFIFKAILRFVSKGKYGSISHFTTT